MRWSEAVTLEFVKIYLKHECLWNPAHSGYKVKNEREKAYARICTEFKDATMKSLCVVEVKMKIKNLRTTYVQQVQKILRKSGPHSIYEPSLIWFNEMDRCLKHVHHSRNSSGSHNSLETPEVDSSSQILWVEEELQNASSDEPNPDPLNSQLDDECDSTKEDKSLTKVKLERQCDPIFLNKRKKKKLKHRNSVNEYSNDLNSELVVRDDEFDIYGKYIATQLRKMDLPKALRLQLEIQNLLSEARMSEIIN